MRFFCSLTLAFALALLPCLSAGCDSSPKDTATPLPMPRLSADGTRIVDPHGDTVVLRGVNLGGWLFNETWMTQIDYSLRGRIHMLAVREGLKDEIEETMLELGYDDSGQLDLVIKALAEIIGAEEAGNFRDLVAEYLPTVYDDSDYPLRRKLAERFGEEGRDELLDVFQEAWITEDDIAWIASHGFTVVRLPIGYRNLIVGPDLDKPEDLSWNEPTFERISRLLDWCERHRLHVVLDIQESPGGHNAFAGEAQLYYDEQMQAMTVEIWEELSRRYQDRSVVAAYSLLAEPFGAPTPEARDQMYDLLVKAIRARGDDTLLVIHDGFFGMMSLPQPDEMGWEGVIYSSHIFEFDARSYEFYESILKFFYRTTYQPSQADHNVPYYVASFSTRIDQPWAYDAAALLLDWFDEREFSWSIWAYKQIDDPIAVELWDRRSTFGLVGRLPDDFDFVRPDVFDDDFETLRARLRAYGELPMGTNEHLLEVLTSESPRLTDR